MNIDRRVAVYGTLRTGQPLAHVWEGAATTNVGIVRNFGLVIRDDVPFPIAKWTGLVDDIVVVEVLRFKKKDVFSRVLAEMDQIEGHPLMYRRQRVDVEFRNSEWVQAWMYVGADPKMFVDGSILMDGDWTEFVTGLPSVIE